VAGALAPRVVYCLPGRTQKGKRGQEGAYRSLERAGQRGRGEAGLRGVRGEAGPAGLGRGWAQVAGWAAGPGQAGWAEFGLS